MSSSNVTATSNPNALPPDVAEARKTRINKDLIECFQRKVNATPPSARGVGLYTHIEGLARAPIYPRERNIPRTGDPEYLPIGGPREIGRDGRLEMETNEEIKKLWVEVNSLVKAEDDLMPAGTSMKKLNERYGALDIPGSESWLQQSSARGGKTSMGVTKDETDHPKTVKSVSFSLEENTSRPSSEVRASSGGPRETEDVIMGGTTERAAATISTGNIYDASRDPRRSAHVPSSTLPSIPLGSSNPSPVPAAPTGSSIVPPEGTREHF